VDKANIASVDRSIIDIFTRSLQIASKNPSYIPFVLKTISTQKKASKVRSAFEENGLHVPPFLIYSITNKCNLKCKGCYAETHNSITNNQMSPERKISVLEEARELGIGVVLLAGGEPLIEKDILTITKDFPEIIFPLFTNGLLIDEEIIRSLKTQKNVIPVVSLEGDKEMTDDRRGDGVFKKVSSALSLLKSNRIFYGVSITISRSNFDLIINEEFIKDLVENGCILFFLVEYVPVEQGTEEQEITQEQREKLKKITDEFSKKFLALFIAFPGSEEEFGGCLAAGRGFLHISAHGDVEPCPFSPFSDSNLNKLTLKEALKSELLLKIRENNNMLTEVSSGCALWKNRDWVESLTSKK